MVQAVTQSLGEVMRVNREATAAAATDVQERIYEVQDEEAASQEHGRRSLTGTPTLPDGARSNGAGNS